jgi:hypothetical protein
MNKINKSIIEYLANLGELSFNKNNSNKQKFNDIFQIEGVPLIYLYSRFFLVHLLPKQLGVCLKVFNDDQNKLTLKEESLAFLKSKMIIHYFSLLNFFKLFYSQKKKVNKTPIIFISYPRHVEFKKSIPKFYRINNIIDQIKINNQLDYNILIVPEFSLSSNKNYNRIKNVSDYYQYVSNKQIRLAKKKSNELHRKWKKLDKSKIPFWKSMKYPLNIYFSKPFLFSTALCYYTLRKIISLSETKVVVLTGKTSLFERTILSLSKEMNFDVVFIPHGIPCSEIDLYHQKYPYYLVPNKSSQETLIQRGYPKDKIENVGPVIFDDLIKYKKNVVEEESILLITSPLVEDNLMFKKIYFHNVRKILSTISKSGYAVTIKLHPREKNLKNYLKIIKNLNLKKTKVICGADREVLYHQIAKNKILIHFHSTAALEAMLLDKIIITYELFGQNNPIVDLTAESKAYHLVNNPLELDELLKKLNSSKNKDFFKKERTLFLNKMFPKLDGNSYKRCITFINKLIDINPQDVNKKR